MGDSSLDTHGRLFTTVDLKDSSSILQYFMKA